MLDDLKNKKKGISDADAEKEVEARLNKMQQIRKKMNELNGISDIEPADKGAYQSDMALTEEQADAILQFLDNPGEITDPVTRAKRSAAIFFEKWPNYRWVSPIRYWVSTAFTSAEQATIDAALNTIASSVGCIQFAKDSSRLSSGSQIQYIKSGVGCSGVSPVGYNGINTIALGTTSWCTGDVLKGLIMHETIHSLGGGHEQSRQDRDLYLTLLWDNIDPQEWDQYAKDVYSTSYGTPYDYKSVMHYEQGTFAVSQGLQTMIPKFSSPLGSSYLSANDILQLKRMYCKSSSCVDKDVNCGYWASVNNYCKVSYVSYMQSNCAKSCGFC